MGSFNVGDIVARKSYGGDVYFKIINIINREKGEPVYVLKSMSFRLEADSLESDLIKQNPYDARLRIKQEFFRARNHAVRYKGPRIPFFLARLRTIPGRILHIDSSGEFLDMCMSQYAESKIKVVGRQLSESEQPEHVKGLLERYNPDILVITGHDGLKKNSGNLHSLDNYRNSKYFVASVKEARKYQPDFDRLCIFAGACQSYYEAIMEAGANFASSPGRVLINALDPAIVSERVSLTDNREYLDPQQVIKLTISGSEGIGGIRTKGHMHKL